MDALEAVLSYHQATKHHPQRYARSLGYMDWATQPDPFRRFHGAPTVPLALGNASASPAYDALYELATIPSQPVCLESISQLFQHSLALSAWKEHQGSRWALRVNPSSGNLHPTEGYVVLGAVDGVAAAPGVFHYAPRDHALEQRCRIPSGTWDRLMDGFPRGTFLAGLSSIHWREAWKYGERAYRYCQHDTGHALAALSLAAAVLGWEAHALGEASDADVSALLGLDRESDFEGAEREHPDALIAVMPAADSRTGDLPLQLPGGALESIRLGAWCGAANRLSSDHVEWELIAGVADRCLKPSTGERASRTLATGPSASGGTRRPPVAARQIIQQRRSAVAMDGRTTITADEFYFMMDRVRPRPGRPPWAALGTPAHVHLGLFVHRVEGLAPGLYFLVRSPAELPRLRESMRREFEWQTPPGCAPSLPLYRLMAGDVQTVAGEVSCGQDIAADGAFSLGMIADFEEPLQTLGAWMYRRLFWETGMIGQVLYLEAEAAGVRGTGIGCFFDDRVHDLFGLAGRAYQSLYHFTVGGPVEDTRLATLPPYPETRAPGR